MKFENKKYYTLFLYLIVYKFYKSRGIRWEFLTHFVSQTIAKFKAETGRLRYVLEIYIEFINTYENNRSAIDGEE